jgi:hypothetical protein
VAPQLNAGWRQNHSTKTRQAACANEQFINSLMSMTIPDIGDLGDPVRPDKVRVFGVARAEVKV